MTYDTQQEVCHTCEVFSASGNFQFQIFGKMSSKELENVDDDDDDDVNDSSLKKQHVDLFSKYQNRSLKFGDAHPGDVVEASSLAAIQRTSRFLSTNSISLSLLDDVQSMMGRFVSLKKHKKKLTTLHSTGSDVQSSTRITSECFE